MSSSRWRAPPIRRARASPPNGSSARGLERQCGRLCRQPGPGGRRGDGNDIADHERRRRALALAEAAGGADKLGQAKTQFEAMMLNSFVGELLPKDTATVFGQGRPATCGDRCSPNRFRCRSPNPASSALPGACSPPRDGAAVGPRRRNRQTAGDVRRPNERQHPLGAGRRRPRQRRILSAGASGHEPTAASTAIPGSCRGLADRRPPHRNHRRGKPGPRAGPAGQIRGLQSEQEPGAARAQSPGPRARRLNGVRAPARCAGRTARQAGHQSAGAGGPAKACHAVSEIIARAIQDGQSDGTYTALAWRRSRE